MWEDKGPDYNRNEGKRVSKNPIRHERFKDSLAETGAVVNLNVEFF
jgi:hypothetical protein